MKSLFGFSVAVLLPCAFLVRVSTAEEKAPGTPETLVKQLQDGDFDERQEAAKKLAQFGESARGVLEKAQASEDLEVRETAKRLLSLLSLASVRMEVMDEQGKPFPDIEGDLTIYDQAGRNPFAVGFGVQQEEKPKSVKTDAKGFALLEGFRPGSMNFNVQWKNAALSTHNQYVGYIEIISGLNRVPYVMTKMGSLKASVVIAETQKPLEGATVLLVPAGQGYEMYDIDQLMQMGWNQQSSATSDAKGVALLEHVAPSNYMAIAKHDDYVAVFSDAIRVRGGEEAALAAPLAMQPKATAYGKLKIKVLADGKPLKKGKVFANANRKPTKEEMQSRAFQRMGWRRFGAWGRGNQQEPLETDDDGIVELKDLKPGTYRLEVSRENQREIVLEDVVVEAGKIKEVTAEKKGQGANITGKVVTAAGKGVQGAQVMAMRIEDLEEYADQGYEPFSQLRQMIQWGERRKRKSNEERTTNADGKYTIKDLAPGEYAIYIVLPRGRPGVVYGIKVEEEKEATAADLVIPDASGAAAIAGTEKQKLNVTGHVIASDGKDLSQGQITLVYRDQNNGGAGSWGSNINRDGAFSFTSAGWGDQEYTMVPMRLQVSIPGYRPQMVDLTEAGLDLKNLQIRLEKQSYTKLKVLVTDDKDQPLRGVQVSSYSYNRNTGQTSQKGTATNAEGEALLSGLAIGKRQFFIHLPGWYAEKPAEITLEQKKEANELKVKLKKALKLSGRCELPEGIDASRVILSIQNNTDQNYVSRTCGLEADGHYALDGLRPGKYTIRACFPGLVLEKPGKLELKDKDMQSDFKFVRSAGLAVDLGKDSAQASAWLLPAGVWNPLLAFQANQNLNEQGTYGQVGNDGRCEFYNIAPGTYDLLITTYTNYRSFGRKTASASILYKGLKTIDLPNGLDDLAKAQAIALKPPEATGNASGRISIKEPMVTGANGNLGSLSVILASDTASATAAFNMPQDFDGRFTPVVAGTPPEGLQVGQPDAFEIRGLPPGEYKIYAMPQIYNYETYVNESGISTRSVPDEKEADPKPLGTIKVESGKTVDAGTTNVELGSKTLERMAKTNEAQMGVYNFSEAGDDEPEVVRP